MTDAHVMAKTVRRKALPPPLENFEAFAVNDFATHSPPEWLVERLIPARSITLLMGKSQARKSFAAIDLAACVASGREFLGRKVKMGSVLYLPLEDSFDLSARLQAVCADFDEETARRFIVSESPVKLPKNRYSFDDLRKFLQIHHVSTIILDTYAYLNDGDMNSPSDTSAILRELRAMILEFNVSIIILCHPALDDEKRPMGAINLFNSVACVLSMKSETRHLQSSITTLKNKGVPIGEKLLIDFAVVELENGASTLKVQGLAGHFPVVPPIHSLSVKDEQVIQLLAPSGEHGMTYAEWASAANSSLKISRDAFGKILRRLKDDPRLKHEDKRYSLVPVPDQCLGSATAREPECSASAGVLRPRTAPALDTRHPEDKP